MSSKSIQWIWAIYNPKKKKYLAKNKFGAIKIDDGGCYFFTNKLKETAVFDDINMLYLYHSAMISNRDWLYVKCCVIGKKLLPALVYNSEEILEYIAQEKMEMGKLEMENEQ